MISFTLNPEDSPSPQSFTQKKVVFGGSDAVDADVQLPGEGLQGVLFQIEEDPEGFVISNLAANPDLQVNGETFEKAPLKFGDRVTLGNLKLRFDSSSPGTGEDMDEDEIDQLISAFEDEEFALDVLGLSHGDSLEDELSEEDLLQQMSQAIEPQKGEESGESPGEDEEDELFSEISDVLGEDDLADLTDPEAEEAPEESAEETSGQAKVEPSQESLKDSPTEGKAESSELTSEEPEALERDVSAFPGQQPDNLDDLDDLDALLEGDLFSDEGDEEITEQEIDRLMAEADELQSVHEAEEAVDALHQETVPNLDIEFGDEESEDEGEEEAPEFALEVDLGERPALDDEEGEEIPEEGAIFGDEELEFEPELAHQRAKPATVFLRGMAAIVIFIVLLIGSFFGVRTYIQGQRGQGELAVARGVADLGMALKGASIAAKMQEQPVPAFYEKKNTSQYLSAVLPKVYLNSTLVKPDGTVSAPNYHVKVLTGQDISHFLLIAYPDPSWWDYFSNAQVLVLHSEDMRIYRTSDIESWEDLLRDKTSLIGVSSRSIEETSLQAAVVLLSSLENDSKNLGYAPPLQLGREFPMAKNRVYNAPRYYPFPANFIELAVKLVSGDGKMEDIKTLEIQGQALSGMDDYVLYDSVDKTNALVAKAAVDMLVPRASVAVGLVELSPRNAAVDQAVLLTGEEILAFNSTFSPAFPQEPIFAVEEEEEFVEPIVEKELPPPQASDPLSQFAYDLAKERKEKLQPIAEELGLLLKQNATEELPNFDERYQELSLLYDEAREQEELRIRGELERLYQQMVEAGEDPRRLIEVLEANHLAPMMPTELAERAQEIQRQKTTKNIIAELEKIRAVKTLPQLTELTGEIASVLNDSYFPDPMELVRLKNDFRFQVLDRVRTFLLAPRPDLLKASELQRNQRKLLEKALTDANVSEVDELGYYLREFDLLMERLYIMPTEEDLAKMENLNEKMIPLVEADPTLSLSNRIRLKADHGKRIREIEGQKKTLDRISQEINQVPVVPQQANDPDTQRLTYGRLGQQILVYQGAQSPSSERDNQLRQAITLLLQGTVHNRALWADVLTAEKLMAETPVAEMEIILDSGIGFHPTDPNLAIDLKRMLQQYSFEKRKIALSEHNIKTINKEQYRVQKEVFEIEQQSGLEEVIRGSQLLQREAGAMVEAMDSYVKRLEVFARDYQKAKELGFFVTHRQYHARMTSRLDRKIRYARALQQYVDSLMAQLIAPARLMEETASRELNSLTEDEFVTLESAEELQKDLQTLHFPNLAADNLSGQLQRVSSIQVNPIP